MTDDETTQLPPARLAESPTIVDSASALTASIERLRSGTGPFGIDAERASGFRYSARAYLVQISRRGGGTHLIDPTAFDSLTELGKLLRTDEWVLHAATQDLACLAELGLVPTRLFDTELGSRLAGFARVGLQAVVAELLGLHLAKEHSAADWSTRPLPDEWLEYAALDVELLPDLRDALATILKEQGKSDIAAQEFDALVSWTPAPPKPDPWRRLSGIQALTTPRQLAIARELWLARDDFAREIDMGPGRVVPDRALVAAVIAAPESKRALAGVTAFTGRYSRKELDRWWAAIDSGTRTEDLPPMRLRGNGLSTPRNWKDRHPEAYARFVCVRASLVEIAENMSLPVENLILPETIRRICFDPPGDDTPDAIAERLREAGARNWQIDAIHLPLQDCFNRVAEDPTPFLVGPAVTDE